MGEIVFSICVGAFLAVSGIAMNIILRREERQMENESSNGKEHS